MSDGTTLGEPEMSEPFTEVVGCRYGRTPLQLVDGVLVPPQAKINVMRVAA
jgi:hypothetical protein